MPEYRVLRIDEQLYGCEELPEGAEVCCDVTVEAFGRGSGFGVRLCDGADVRIHGASLRPAFLAGASGNRSQGCRIRDKAYTFHPDQPPATGL